MKKGKEKKCHSIARRNVESGLISSDLRIAGSNMFVLRLPWSDSFGE